MKNMKERTYSFFKMNRLILVLLCLFFATNIYAQNREIRGMVTGDDNEPLAGATITIKNRQGGIIVDIDGKFTIKAKTGEILVVSFLGMKKQEVKIDNKDFYAIKLLPETNEFDEVTVGAFAKQKKESVISAVSTVNPQELKVPSSNLTTALAGRMSGLIAFQTSGEPGKDNAQFFVRGATTFGYKKDPLILIDNIELSTDDLARLNVDDIAQFSIMKDATATALYGARGANGVILVTTKQGTAGRPKVSVRVEQSVSTPRKKVKLTDPVNFMKLNNEAVNSRRDPNNPAASANYTVYSQEKIENTIAGTNPYYYPAVDWYDELFNDYALSTRVNANLSGGGSAVRYYVAASYTKDGGVIKNDKLNNYNSNINWQRYSVRSNINMDLSKTTEFAIRVNGNFDDYTGPLDSGEGLYKKVMKTSPVLYPKSYPATDEYANNTHVLFGNANKGAYINPYADMVRGYKESNNLLVAAQAELKQKLDFITQGLDARVLVSTTRSSYSDLTRAINPYNYQANYDKTNNSYTLTNIVEGEEYLSYDQGAKNINTTNYIEAAVSYGRTFGAHATSGMLVYTRREEKRSSEKTLQQSLPRRNQGIAGRFTYAYDSRYFAEFNFGYNGSERFAAHERYGFFPSFGLGYIISNEDFWIPLRNTVDKLKFKLTYGLVGNDAIGSSEDRFYYLSEVNPNDGNRDQFFGTDYDNHMNGVSVSRYPNIYITWEKSKKVNLGFELGMFNSALEIQTDFFYERRTQIYQPRAHIPSSMGLSAGVSANIGEASSRGIDLSANYSYIANKDFWIKGMGNFTLAKGRYEVYEELDYASYGQGYRSRIGQAINHNYGYIAERLFIDVNDVANSPSQ
ncbi:TonB-dependent receptor, partial [Bacteroides thetaiotaomicron]